jgi:hypothetical protein
MGLASLGQSIIKKVATKKIRINASLDGLISKFDKSCPSKTEMIKIINQRNKLVLVLTQLKRNVIKLDKSTQPLKPLLSALNKSSKLLKNNPIPVAVGAPAVAFPLGNILTASDSLSTIKSKLTGITSTILAFGIIKKYIIKTIDNLLNKVKLLDSLTQKCIEKSTNLSNSISTTGNPNISFNSLSNIESISDSDLDIELNNILNNEESDLIGELQSSDENSTNTYNGFLFEILIDNNNTTRFTKRYAVAKSQSGIILLKGEPSFSSSTEVLISELKFIIDRDNLKSF